MWATETSAEVTLRCTPFMYNKSTVFYDWVTTQIILCNLSLLIASFVALRGILIMVVVWAVLILFVVRWSTLQDRWCPSLIASQPERVCTFSGQAWYKVSSASLLQERWQRLLHGVQVRFSAMWFTNVIIYQLSILFH